MGVRAYGGLSKAATIASLPVFLAVARFFPWERLPSPCVFYHLTGLPCPSCGMTRSAVALSHLNFARAVHMNLLGPVLMGVFGLWWVYSIYEIATGRRTRLLAWGARRKTLLVVIGLVVFVLYGVIRIALIVHGCAA